MAGISFEAVKKAVSAREVAEREGLRMDHNRAFCPWCNHPSRANLAFNRDGTCHCFSCNKTADCIELAAHVWHVGRLDAAHRLNDELRLGLTATSTISDARKAKLSARDARRAAAEKAVNDAQAELDTALLTGDRRKIDLAEQWLRLKRCEIDHELYEPSERPTTDAKRTENALFAAAADELREAEEALYADTETDWIPALLAKVQRAARARERWENLWAGGVNNHDEG